jgi:UDP-N-acetylmuramate: L-alanyl-gamma-D-glutamyl-meso-diaminopimelate ligase
MEQSDLQAILNKPGSKLYFVGIGGIAMSAAASLAAASGFEVSGSDSKEVYSPAKDILEKQRLNYFVGYDIKHIIETAADLYILSAGEDETNPEVKYIVEHGLPRCGFPELLYELSEGKLRVVVAGTHGKSTTSGLLGHILKNLDDSSFLTGAVTQNYKSNFHQGTGHYFVFEGDEYKTQFDDPTPKFHYYKPDILVLTNLEFDHPDMFLDFASLEEEVRLLIHDMPDDGLIVYNSDNAALVKLVQESNLSQVSFGLENEADFKVDGVDYGKEFTTFEVINKFSTAVSSQLLGQTEQYKIQLPGKINIYNSLGAIALLRSLGFAQEQIALDLLTYKGVKRRFEIVGIKNGITIIDDYAHHPTAVRETLQAARLRYPKAKIWAVFEPHTFSRTKATLDELVKAFGSADEVLISEIYPARERASEASITSQEVVSAIKNYAPKTSSPANISLIRDKQEALDKLKSNARPGDVVLVMAVGSFNRLAFDLKDSL